MQTDLRRDTLADQVAQCLLDFILDQGLQPGHALSSELKLTQQFGVSRHVVREALRSLEARGIIGVATGKPAVVKPITGDLMRDFFEHAVRFKPETAIELLEVRRGIEMQAALLAAQRRTDDDLTEMAGLLAGMTEFLYNAHAYTECDAALHLLIARASHNTMLYHLVASICQPLQEIIRDAYALSTQAERETLPGIHAAIVGAISRADPTAATAAMERHFEGALLGYIQGHATAAVAT